MQNQESLFVKMALDGWNAHLKRADELFDSITDEQLENEVSPGRNRGIYLLGHLAAVHDRMLPLLGFGEPLRPELDQVFVFSPDKSGLEMPPAAELRLFWKNVNARLADRFAALRPGEWFEKHTAVSAEDFEKEPHRNRLNVLLSRTNHLANHLGQVVFLKPKS